MELKSIGLSIPRSRESYQHSFEQIPQFSDRVPRDFFVQYAELDSGLFYPNYAALFSDFAADAHAKRWSVYQHRHRKIHGRPASFSDPEKLDRIAAQADNGLVRLHFAAHTHGDNVVSYLVFAQEGEEKIVKPVSCRIYCGGEKLYSWNTTTPTLDEKELVLGVVYKKTELENRQL